MRPRRSRLGRRGYARRDRDDADALRHAASADQKNPLGSAAGYGTPNPAARPCRHTAPVGFPVTHEAGDRGASCRAAGRSGSAVRVALLMQDLGRLAADLPPLCHASVVGHPARRVHDRPSIAAAETQPRRVRALVPDAPPPRAASMEVMGITASCRPGTSATPADQGAAVPSVDLCGESLSIMAAAILCVAFRPERIRMDADIHAAAEANARWWSRKGSRSARFIDGSVPENTGATTSNPLLRVGLLVRARRHEPAASRGAPRLPCDPRPRAEIERYATGIDHLRQQQRRRASVRRPTNRPAVE